MKKLFAILLAAMMLASFAGCAVKGTQSEPHNHTHDHTHIETQTETSDKEGPSAQTAATESVAQATESSTESSENTTQAHSSTQIKRGMINGNVYTSSTLNLTFIKPSNWAFAEEPDLVAYSGIDSDSFGDFNTAAKENPAVYDMYAAHKESGTSVTLCYENLQITKGDSLSAKDYSDMIKNAFCETPDSTVLEEGTVDFGGNTYHKLAFKSSNADTTLIRIYYLRRIDRYMATVIFTLPENADISVDSMFN